MKSIIKLAFTVVLISLTAAITHAQTKFTEGKIVYTITMADNDMDPQMASMMPKEMTMSTKGDMSRLDMVTGMGNIVSIFDRKAKIGTTLMDIMGNKTAIKMTEADIKKEQGDHKKTIKYLNDTKVIAGYTCHNAEVTTEGSKDKDIVWYSKDITSSNPSAWRAGLGEIDGFLMEYTVNQRGMNMKMTAKSITQITIDESIFKIPDGYKEMTMEQMKAMRGGH